VTVLIAGEVEGTRPAHAFEQRKPGYGMPQESGDFHLTHRRRKAARFAVTQQVRTFLWSPLRAGRFASIQQLIWSQA
jgi:hypothetical protein